jgi:hypothetical protein
MNFKEWLNESPLQHYGYEFHSENEPDEGFLTDKTQKKGGIYAGNNQWDIFSKKDKILISHPKTFKTLEEKLRKSSFNFIILLIEQHNGLEPPYGLDEDQIRDYLDKNNIDAQTRKNSIIFAKDATSGHLLTPWMILHTIGHALTDSSRTRFYINEINQTLWDIEKTGESGFLLNPLKKVFVFKSIKDSNVPNRDELINELIAEFLWNGKIRINPEIASLKFPEEIKSKVLSIEEDIKKCLNLCVGTIIWDKLT